MKEDDYEKNQDRADTQFMDFITRTLIGKTK